MAPVEAMPRLSTTTCSPGFSLGTAKSSSGLGGRPPRLLTHAVVPLRSMAAANGAMPVSVCRTTSPLPASTSASLFSHTSGTAM
jgi:hypothetical protein